MPNITTSVSQESYNLAKEKHIKWNVALERGIKAEASGKYVPEEGVKFINVTEKNRLAQMGQALVRMQEHIDELNKQLEKKNAMV